MSEINFDEEEDELVFPSGAKAYVPYGIVGIDGNGEVFAGYDQRLEPRPHGVTLSKEDRVALGKLMIERWTAWMNEEGKETV